MSQTDCPDGVGEQTAIVLAVGRNLSDKYYCMYLYARVLASAIAPSTWQRAWLRT